MVTIACIVIASDKRLDLLHSTILPSIETQGFDEVVVVGDATRHPPQGCRWYGVAPLTRTTADALVKRDVGALVTTSDLLVYLCDDHALDSAFLPDLKRILEDTGRMKTADQWDVFAPDRWGVKDDAPIRLNMGAEEGYCGGHACIIWRDAVIRSPWTCGPYDRNWDRTGSEFRQALGQRFGWARGMMKVWDKEPGAEPWR